MLRVGRRVFVRSMAREGNVVASGPSHTTVRFGCGTELVFGSDDIEYIHREPSSARCTDRAYQTKG